ncbi:MAG: hypothetical protein LQ342_003463 [Letrouitia transgressa]|nr:MAG: hypothetical protein LQ342_003463 [Letrouitia transgressa]
MTRCLIPLFGIFKDHKQGRMYHTAERQKPFGHELLGLWEGFLACKVSLECGPKRIAHLAARLHVTLLLRLLNTSVLPLASPLRSTPYSDILLAKIDALRAQGVPKSEIVTRVPVPETVHQPLRDLTAIPAGLSTTGAEGHGPDGKWLEKIRYLLQNMGSTEESGANDKMADEERMVVTGHRVGEMKVLKWQV